MFNEAMSGMSKYLIHKRDVYALRGGEKVKFREFTFIGDLANGQAVHEMEHLACFVPGMLALGSWTGRQLLDSLHTNDGDAGGTARISRSGKQQQQQQQQQTNTDAGGDGGDSPVANAQEDAEAVLAAHVDEHLQLAQALVETCVASYFDTTTGLGPESIYFGRMRQQSETPNLDDPTVIQTLQQSQSSILLGYCCLQQLPPRGLNNAYEIQK